MRNYVEIELTDTYDDLARKINRLDPVAPLDRETVAPETLGATSETLVSQD